MPKPIVLDRDRYVAIGRRYSSELVAQELSPARARWERDLPVLQQYALGPDALAEFDALRQKHQALLVARSGAVAEKSVRVREQSGLLREAWAVVDQLEAVLLRPARQEQELALALQAASPADDADLPASLVALAGLLTARAERLPAGIDAVALAEQAHRLTAALGTLPGTVSTAKAATVQDTVEIDELDGRLYVTLLDLNTAARKAIRRGLLAARREDYRLHYLRGATRAEQPAPPAAGGDTPPS